MKTIASVQIRFLIKIVPQTSERYTFVDTKLFQFGVYSVGFFIEPGKSVNPRKYSGHKDMIRFDFVSADGALVFCQKVLSSR